jgi:ornithine carbamoyltransferase
MLLTRFGADVVLAHPEGYALTDDTLDSARRHAAESGSSFRVTHAMDDAFAGADVVYPKSWGPHELMLERVRANRARDAEAMRDIERRALDRNAAHRDWICDERRMALTRKGDAMYLHCLPADIGAEVTPGVFARHRVNVAREANKKLYVIMALLAVAKVRDLERRIGELRP